MILGVDDSNMSAFLCLLYHDVCEDNRSSGFSTAGSDLYKISPERFAEHLRILTGQDAVRTLFTFDDGGSSMMIAADLLEQHGKRGIFFIASGFTGTVRFLGSGDLRSLHERGHVIGSHSHSHTIPMTGMPRAAMVSDWRTSKAFLEDTIGSAVVTASVPGGVFSSEMLKELSALGFSDVFTSAPFSPLCKRAPICRGRYSINSTTSTKLLSEVASGKVLPLAAQSVARIATDIGRVMLGSSWYKLRDRLHRSLNQYDR